MIVCMLDVRQLKTVFGIPWTHILVIGLVYHVFIRIFLAVNVCFSKVLQEIG